MSEKPTQQFCVPGFIECVIICARNSDFVEGYERLTGNRFATTPIEQMIDESTGFDKEQCWQFCAFVWETVWSRLNPEMFRTNVEKFQAVAEAMTETKTA